ncbi:MAG: hypothetical protein KIT33_15630 [Candidatus Kapabacteria bacterium]|nr:hypothetical protein [Ignavibacteriota bacterium]MCW5886401.1 hypothetical protein [Candidatus Kapabacteria bacterium]
MLNIENIKKYATPSRKKYKITLNLSSQIYDKFNKLKDITMIQDSTALLRALIVTAYEEAVQEGVKYESNTDNQA